MFNFNPSFFRSHGGAGQAVLQIERQQRRSHQPPHLLQLNHQGFSCQKIRLSRQTSAICFRRSTQRVAYRRRFRQETLRHVQIESDPHSG